jgi:HlyD family secretion protein
MTRLQKSLIAGGVVVLLGAIVAASVLSGDSEEGTEVYMAEAGKRDVVSSVSATGRLEPRTKVEVQSLVMGEIVKLPVKEGDRVRRGDLLVQLDPERYRAEVQALEANLRVARIEVERQDAALANLRATLRRHERLNEQGILPADQLERTQLDVKTGEIQLSGLKEQVAQAGSGLDKARDDLRKTTLITPIDGIVTQLNAELGEMTMTGTMNNPGTVIMTVADLGEILAEVDVDETRIVQVAPGQRARVVVDAVGELKPYEGRVVEIAGTAVQRQGSEVQVFPVKIALDAPDGSLRPGMTAKARIETKRAEAAVTVPIQSVVLKPDKEVETVLAERGKKKEGKRDRKDGKKDGGKEPAAVETASAKGKDDAVPAATPAKAEAAASPPAAPPRKGAKDDQREVVFKVVDGKAVLVPVRTGLSDDTDVVVLEGLQPGDRIVTGPYRALKKLADGEAVRKKTEKESKDEDSGEDEESGVEVEVD